MLCVFLPLKSVLDTSPFPSICSFAFPFIWSIFYYWFSESVYGDHFICTHTLISTLASHVENTKIDHQIITHIFYWLWHLQKNIKYLLCFRTYNWSLYSTCLLRTLSKLIFPSQTTLWNSFLYIKWKSFSANTCLLWSFMLQREIKDFTLMSIDQSSLTRISRLMATITEGKLLICKKKVFF